MEDQNNLDYKSMWARLKYQIELCEAKELPNLPPFVIRAFMEFIEGVARYKDGKHGP